jgi:multiple sugar transport system permease protein
VKNLESARSVSKKNKQTPVLNRKKSRIFSNEALLAYLFISPFIIGIGIFYIIPAIASFFLSFTIWDGLSTPVFNGVQNFVAMSQDQMFKRSIINTFVFTILAVPASIVLATLIAVLLNQKIKGMVIYRTLFFIPVVTMPVAVGMVWRWLYNSEFGLINYSLSLLSLPQIGWLFDERFALISIVLASIWMTVGNSTVILLAGLQGISTTYYEAAVMDGANEIKKFFFITIPLLTPSLFFVLVMSMITSLQVFDLVYMMMGENIALLGPTRTIVYSMWEQGFKYFNMGYASAQALLLFLIILILTIVQMYLQKKWVHY